MGPSPYIITVFGAESTGKTTLSKQIAQEIGGEWICEFARPYLEETGTAITRQSMGAIWQGQKQLQETAAQTGKKIIVQDTDLFSTVGYWQLPHVTPAIGECPRALVSDAARQQSNLYIITKSNIPFEQDQLRYGGDVRESTDKYWIDLCDTYKLPYVVLASSEQRARLTESINTIKRRSSLLCAA